MNSPIKSRSNTIDEENEDDNAEEDDFGSEEDDSQNDESRSDDDLDRENDEHNPEDDTLVQQQENEYDDEGEQDEDMTHSEGEDDDSRNQEEEDEEEEEEGEEGEGEEGEEEEEEVEEKEEQTPPPPPPPAPSKRPAGRKIPKSMFYRELQQQHRTQRQQRQQNQQARTNQRQQQRQPRKRWDGSPQRTSNQRVHQHRLRDYKDNYLGDTMSLRLTIPQVNSLKQEVANTLQDSLAKTDYIRELEQRLKAMEIDNNQLQRINLLTEKKMENFQKSLHDSNRYYGSLANEMSAAKAEIEKLKQSVKSETHASSVLEKRLALANGEIEKTKAEFQKMKEASKDQEESYRKKVEELKRIKKGVEKQNLEMQKVIRKHMQLIGNLKRQVMHVEAAAVLKISEDQFMKALERSS